MKTVNAQIIPEFIEGIPTMKTLICERRKLIETYYTKLWKRSHYIYNKFLLERYLNFFKFTKISFVEDIFSFYRNRNHFSYKKNIIVSEREMLKDFFE